MLYLKTIPPVVASGHKPSYYLGLSEESLAVPVSLLPGQESCNLDVLLELLISASDEARVTQPNRK